MRHGKREKSLGNHAGLVNVEEREWPKMHFGIRSSGRLYNKLSPGVKGASSHWRECPDGQAVGVGKPELTPPMPLRQNDDRLIGAAGCVRSLQLRNDLSPDSPRAQGSVLVTEFEVSEGIGVMMTAGPTPRSKATTSCEPSRQGACRPCAPRRERHVQRKPLALDEGSGPHAAAVRRGGFTEEPLEGSGEFPGALIAYRERHGEHEFATREHSFGALHAQRRHVLGIRYAVKRAEGGLERRWTYIEHARHFFDRVALVEVVGREIPRFAHKAGDFYRTLHTVRAFLTGRPRSDCRQ